MRLLRHFCSVLVICGCNSSVRDARGWGACDLTQEPCSAGELCVAGRCASSSPDASSGWRQKDDGFDAISSASDWRLAIDLTSKNALTATVTPGISGAQVTGNFLGRFPEKAEGRIQGKLEFRSEKPLAGKATFLVLRTRNGMDLVNLSLWSDQAVLNVGEGVLQPSRVINSLGVDAFPAVSNLLVSGRENAIAVTWRQGSYVRIAINGEATFECPLASFDHPEQAFLAEVRLGVNDYSGAHETDLGFVYRDWEIDFP